MGPELNKCHHIVHTQRAPLNLLPPPAMSHPPQRNRGWWREFFEDHPGLTAKTPDSYTNPNLARPDKQKVWCKPCFAKRIEDERARDRAELGTLRVAVRDDNTIIQSCT